jgi:hypothetical protein
MLSRISANVKLPSVLDLGLGVARIEGTILAMVKEVSIGKECQKPK